MGGQEHFYMETQGCLVVPKGENEEMEIVSSTQGVNLIQLRVAKALGISSNRVKVKVKRVGKCCFT